VSKILNQTFTIKPEWEHIIGVKTNSMQVLLPKKLKVVPFEAKGVRENGKVYTIPSGKSNYQAINLDIDKDEYFLKRREKTMAGDYTEEYGIRVSYHMLISASMLRKYYAKD